MMAGFDSAHYDQHGRNRNATIGGCEGRNRTSIFGLRSQGVCRGYLWRIGARKVIGSEAGALLTRGQILARWARAPSLINFQLLPKYCHKMFKRILLFVVKRKENEGQQIGRKSFAS